MMHVQAFLAAADLGPVKDPTTVIQLLPVGAQTKASDGPDWTIACVLLETFRTRVEASSPKYELDVPLAGESAPTTPTTDPGSCGSGSSEP